MSILPEVLFDRAWVVTPLNDAQHIITTQDACFWGKSVRWDPVVSCVGLRVDPWSLQNTVESALCVV